MSSELLEIAQNLNAWGGVFINEEGTYLFTLVGSELMVAASPLRNLHEMTENELDEFIVSTFRK